MSEAWLQQWRKFIKNEGASDGTGRGAVPPGPIDNARLLGRGGKPLPNQRAVIHYRGVNVNVSLKAAAAELASPPPPVLCASSPLQVWTFLHDIYGGGPALRRRTIDLYEEEAT